MSAGDFFRKNRKLTLILLFAVMLRLPNIANPITEVYPTKQALNAMVARNYYEGGFNVLYPEVDRVFDHPPTYYGLEFGLLPLVTALLYLIFGGVYEALGRLVSIAFFCGSLIMLHKLTKKLFTERVALLACLAFTLSPASVIFSQTFQSEFAAMFFSLAAVYYFLEGLGKKKSMRGIFIAGFSAALAFSIKLIYAPVLLPLLAYAAFTRHGKKFFLKNEFLLFLFLAAAPLMLWIYWTTILHSIQPHPWATPTTFTQVVYSDADYVSATNPLLYKTLLKRLVTVHFTPLGFMLLLVGLTLLPKKKNQRLIYVWAFLALASFPLLSGQNFHHEYYQLPLLPAASIFIARAAASLGKIKLLKSKPVLVALALLILAMTVFFARPVYRPILKDHPVFADSHWVKRMGVAEAGRAVDAAVGENALIIQDEGPVLLYYSRRRGFDSLPYNYPKGEIIDDIESSRLKGAEYFVFFHGQAEQAPYYPYLTENYRTLNGVEGGYVIFDLRRAE